MLTFYLLAGTKAGTDQIKIAIPGLDPFIINITIQAAPANTLEITLPKKQIQPGTTLTGEITVRDNRGNIVTSQTTIKSSTTSNITAALPTAISGGQQTFSMKGEKS